MIIERIENRVGKDPLMEISGSSLEAKPEDCAVGSKFFCTDTRDTYEKTENEWKLISGGRGVSGGFNGVKIPKDCACFITEYGDAKIIQEQSDDQYYFLDFPGAPIKGKNLGKGLENRGKSMALNRDGSNLLLGVDLPWTLEEYDLNGLTIAPAFGFFMGQIKKIKGIEKLTTIDYGAFSGLIWGDPNSRAEEICFENVEQIVMPQWYIDLTAEIGETSETSETSGTSGTSEVSLQYNAGVFANSVIIADKVRFPKLTLLPECALADFQIDTLEFDALETIGYGGFHGLCCDNIIIRTNKKCEFEVDSEYNVSSKYTRYNEKVAVKVPANLLSEYQNDPKWSRFVSNGTIMLSAIEE